MPCQNKSVNAVNSKLTPVFIGNFFVIDEDFTAIADVRERVRAPKKMYSIELEIDMGSSAKLHMSFDAGENSAQFLVAS
jgi:hypothetical protein